MDSFAPQGAKSALFDPLVENKLYTSKDSFYFKTSIFFRVYEVTSF